MKTILNIKFKDETLQVPAQFLFEYFGRYWFVHRSVISVSGAGIIDYSEKFYTLCEYETGVKLTDAGAKGALKNAGIDILNKYGSDKMNEAIQGHEVINFNAHEVLPFAIKANTPSGKKSVLGKYVLSDQDIIEAEKEHNTEKKTYPFKNALADIKRWIKFANEVIMLSGYKATLGKCERNGFDQIIITHDKGSYKVSNDDTGILRRALMEAFNVDGAGEYLRPEPIARKKKEKPLIVKETPKTVILEPGDIPEEPDPADLIFFTATTDPSMWIHKNGLAIEFPDHPTGENSTGITYDPPMLENRMYVDKAGILWEFTQGWALNEFLSIHTEKLIFYDNHSDKRRFNQSDQRSISVKLCENPND